MKRYGNLYERIFTEENVLAAVKEACKGKRKTRRILKTLADPEALARDVLSNPHPLSDYREGYVTDASSGKTRHILKPSMHDQALHHSIIRVIRPYLEKGSYIYSAGAIKERGPLYASNALCRFLRRHPGKSRWFIKLDAVKYYENINRTVLKDQLAHLFKDRRLLALLGEVIDGVPGTTGIPIGNLTSQYLANFHLQGFDRWVKEELHATFYLRYMDDMLIVGPNKRVLARQAEAMARKLEGMGLRIHRERMAPRRVGRDNRGTAIDICGYRHYRTGIRTMRKRLWKRLRRQLLRARDLINRARATILASRHGWYSHSKRRHIDREYGAGATFALAFHILRKETLAI